MPQIHTTRRKPVTAVLVLLFASLVLAACGGSSSTTSSSTNASATTSTAAGASGANTGRFAALRACLQKNGVTLPQRTPGQNPQRGLGLLGGSGGPQLPKGVTRAQYEAAAKKCGGFAGRGPAGGGTAARLSSPAFKQGLAKFAACMTQHGVKVPAPNTSGKGPIFNTTGLNTKSAQFKAAESSCFAVLRSAFPARGTGGAPGGP
jgi:hypothetical protein